MKMINRFRSIILFLAILLSSCGGGGGGQPFFLNVNSFTFTTDEDVNYSGNLTYNSNGSGSISFLIESNPQNGSVKIGSSGSFTYFPDPDFNGSDSFTYKATSITENYTSSAATVSITINPVDDPPVINLFSSTLSENIIFIKANDPILFNGTISDVDSSLDEIILSAELIKDGELLRAFTESNSQVAYTIDSSGNINLTLDLITQIDAGYYSLSIKACDTNNQDLCGNDSIMSHFATGYREVETHRVYNLMGSYGTYSDSRRNTDMLIIADSIDDSDKSIDTEKFREKTLDSLDLLYNSTASDYFDGFFNVMIVEPISADGSSSIDMVADGNCVDWSDNIFCYSESKLTAIELLLFPEIYADITAIISALPGRGVTSYYSNRPTTMVQPIAERTARTFGHELGHAHANLGDEYSSDGEREYTSEEIENYSYWDINVAVDDDPNTIKWSHFINDKTSVPGIDPLADIDQTGIFEGSYYSESDSYRPKQYSIMGCSRCEDLDPGCWTVQFERNNCADFIEVHTEGFGIQSVLNLFRNPFDNDGTEFTGDSEIEGIKIKAGIVSGGKIDTSKLKLEWYKDGILVNGQNNNLQVDFQRPNTDTWTTYSWKLVDLTGAIIVPDNIDDPNDCYLGLFDWYSGAFQTENQSTVYWNPPFNLNDSRYQDYLYGYTMGCMSGTLMINWNKY